MFQRILKTKRIQSHTRTFLWFLVAVLIVPLILFFHTGSGSNQQGPGGLAGEIFGRPVPWDRFDEEYRLLQRDFSTRFGGELPEGVEPFLRQQAWDRLILRAEAERRRIRVSDDDLADHLRGLAAFQENGRFVPARYYDVIRRMGQSPRAVEERLREELRVQRLLDTVRGEVAVTEDEARAAFERARAQVRIAALVIHDEDTHEALAGTLTEEALLTLYGSNLPLFQRPARRRLAYLGATLEELLPSPEDATEERLSAYYDEHAEEWTQEDGTARPLEEVRDEVRERWRAQRARRRLNDLAVDLEEDRDARRTLDEIAAARQLSVRRTDPIDQQLLALPAGLSREMLAEAFATPLGELTPLQEGAGGVFLIQPTDELPAFLPPFEEVRDEVRRRWLLSQMHAAAEHRARQFREEFAALRALGRSAEDAWSALGLTPARPAPFTRDGPIDGVGPMPPDGDALFQLQPGDVSEVHEVPRGWFVAVLEERLPVDDADFEKEKTHFTEEARTAKQAEHATTWLTDLRGRAALKDYTTPAEHPAP